MKLTDRGAFAQNIRRVHRPAWRIQSGDDRRRVPGRQRTAAPDHRPLETTLSTCSRHPTRRTKLPSWTSTEPSPSAEDRTALRFLFRHHYSLILRHPRYKYCPRAHLRNQLSEVRQIFDARKHKLPLFVQPRWQLEKSNGAEGCNGKGIKVNGIVAVRNTPRRYTRTHVPYGITQCYLPPVGYTELVPKRSGARFTKYLTTSLRLSYDNATVTIDLRRLAVFKRTYL